MTISHKILDHLLSKKRNITGKFQTDDEYREDCRVRFEGEKKRDDVVERRMKIYTEEWMKVHTMLPLREVRKVDLTIEDVKEYLRRG